MNYTEVGKNIKKYRKGKMTQAQLGKKIGKTESSIRKYEKGLVEIPWKVLEQIAFILGVKVYELLDESVDKRPTEEIIDDIYTTHLMTHFDKLTNDGKEMAIKQVKMLTQIPGYQKLEEAAKIVKSSPFSLPSIEAERQEFIKKGGIVKLEEQNPSKKEED